MGCSVGLGLGLRVSVTTLIDVASTVTFWDKVPSKVDVNSSPASDVSTLLAQSSVEFCPVVAKSGEEAVNDTSHVAVVARRGANNSR